MSDLHAHRHDGSRHGRNDALSIVNLLGGWHVLLQVVLSLVIHLRLDVISFDQEVVVQVVGGLNELHDRGPSIKLEPHQRSILNVKVINIHLSIFSSGHIFDLIGLIIVLGHLEV